jgi:predicted  nucleic acid-binding Zn-ribbon protein
MKEKTPVIILLATTLGLGILLVVQHNSAKAREKTTTVAHQKQVTEFEGQVGQLANDLKANGRDLSVQAEEVNSLGAKLTLAEKKTADIGQELDTITKARDQALDDIAKADVALKQNQQELLDTKSNVTAVETKLGETVNELATTKENLVVKNTALTQATEKLGTATTQLTQAKDELEKKNGSLVAALKELEDGQARIARLETDLQVVNQQVGGLKTQINSLAENIGVTQRKLAAAVGDRAFLLRELKRMQEEKAELEKHLNNLEYVRTQYKMLKSKWASSERLRMIREGIGQYGKKDPNEKGVSNLRKLARRNEKPANQGTASQVNPDQLSVELKSDGTVTIVQPGEEPREVVPAPKTPEAPKPPVTDEPKLKGVVTPAPESVLPDKETKPAVPTPKSETPPVTKPAPAPAVPSAPAPKPEPAPKPVPEPAPSNP